MGNGALDNAGLEVGRLRAENARLRAVLADAQTVLKVAYGRSETAIEERARCVARIDAALARAGEE
jgi:hypothetical protein